MFLEKKYNDKLLDYKFRVDKPGFVSAIFANKGKIMIKDSLDSYMRSFYKTITLRDCCYECQFKKLNRQGDITIGDFWGVENYSKDFVGHDGVSLIIFNNAKASSYKERILSQGKNAQFGLRDIGRHNQFNGNQGTKITNFYQDLNNGLSFDKAVKKNAPISLKSRLRQVASKILPRKVKALLKRLLLR